jgi:chromosome segregation ATPase
MSITKAELNSKLLTILKRKDDLEALINSLNSQVNQLRIEYQDILGRLNAIKELIKQVESKEKVKE